MLKDQWDLFASSVGVIGPHGAGLANMIVMKAHSVVVEFLVVGKDINLCYLNMAISLQHVYRAVVPIIRKRCSMLTWTSHVNMAF